MSNEYNQVRDRDVVEIEGSEHASYYHATKLYWFFVEQVSNYGLVFDVAVNKVSKVLGLAGGYSGTTNDFKELVLEPLITEISKKTELAVKCSLTADGRQNKLRFVLKDTGEENLARIAITQK